MAKIIMHCLERWYDNRNPIALHLPTTDPTTAELHHLINVAYDHQTYIGWGHFLRGRISLHWKPVLAHYYKERKPGKPHSPKLWARKTVDQIWQTFLDIWQCRNGELHGKDYKEQREIALRTTREEVQRIYEVTRDHATDRESRYLHPQPVSEILRWTKRHLDAYLATAEVILEQNVDPG
jgi:hypothetical protein